MAIVVGSAIVVGDDAQKAAVTQPRGAGGCSGGDILAAEKVGRRRRRQSIALRLLGNETNLVTLLVTSVVNVKPSSLLPYLCI